MINRYRVHSPSEIVEIIGFQPKVPKPSVFSSSSGNFAGGPIPSGLGLNPSDSYPLRDMRWVCAPSARSLTAGPFCAIQPSSGKLSVPCTVALRSGRRLVVLVRVGALVVAQLFIN